MSSDRRGSVGGATGPASAAASADGGASEDVADDAQADDPWFAPGPKKAAGPDDLNVSADTAETDEHAGQTEWFLRTGRAGLHPDSVTSSDDASGELTADHHGARVTAAGAPPWAGETTAVSASTPPPWETGPWPGPTALRSQGSHPLGDEQAGTTASRAAATAGLAGGGAAVSADADGTGPVATPVRWPARTVVTVGLIPLVVPGLVLGFLSLRQAGSEAVRKASWLAIGASIAWAVIIIVIVASVSGGSTGGCSGYPAAVRQAYEKALTDLRGNAPASAEATDLETAASLANSSAAAAGQIGVRNSLFTMANDLLQARADVVARRPISALLRQHIAADGAVPSGSCTS